MSYGRLADTGIRVSRLAMGTMSFGADATADAAIFARCRDVGINVFDCANVYKGGESERALGRLVNGCRDEIVLTTKSYFPTSADPNARGNSRYHLVRAVEDSLKRLDTDRIDLFFLHRFDEHTSLDVTLRAVEDLVRSGKILHLGLSNFAAWQAQMALGTADVLGCSRPVAMQPMYNLAKRQAESEILPMCHANGLAVFPYSPLGGGLLTGKYKKRGEGTGRLVDNPMYQRRYEDEAHYELAAAFVKKANELGLHPVTLAVAWVESHPAVTAPLLGARTVEQLEPALAALDVTLSLEDREALSRMSRPPAPATDRSEEGSSFDYASQLTR